MDGTSGTIALKGLIQKDGQNLPFGLSPIP